MSTQKFIITGASGFIGRQLVPRLLAHDAEVLLVGRDPAALSENFPAQCSVCSYDDLAGSAEAYHTLIHLAVLNNDSDHPAAAFEDVNVQLLLRMVSVAKAAGVKHVVNVTTLHALDGHGTPYADSKRRALDLLSEEKNIAITNLFLPAVYGDAFAGKLAIVDRLPKFLQSAGVKVLSALAPTLHIDRLADFVTQTLTPDQPEVFLANPQSENIVYRASKKFIDLLFVAAVVVFLGWLLIICWIWIKFDSKGPAIFVQDRVGKKGKVFSCYKFRTMQDGTRQAGTHEMSAASLTRVGNILRKTKIDEFPQIVNILKGEMSLIGPRPCLPVQTELVSERLNRGVLNIVPGISGYAQIAGVDMSDPVKLAKIDERYLAMRSLLLDIKIILRTFLGGGSGDKIKK